VEDSGHYYEKAAEALRDAEEEKLPNARLKHLRSAAAWEAMGKRLDRVKAAADRNAEARRGQESA
jgi:hypothetical protein